MQQNMSMRVIKKICLAEQQESERQHHVLVNITENTRNAQEGAAAAIVLAHREIHVHYTNAATRFHRDGGDGRLLAAFVVVEPAEEAGHELPQKQRWAPDEQAGFRNKTKDSEDLESNISGVVEPQNRILYQIEMNPVKKYLEMHEETNEKKEDHKMFFTIKLEDPILNIYQVDEQQNKILFQNETNSVKMGLKMPEKNRREEGGSQIVPH